MIRSLLIVIGSAIALAGCSSLPARPGPQSAAALSCPHHRSGPLRSRACRPFTRTYSQQQLHQTGQTNLAQALQMLDPSVSVTGGGS